ncbi:MAG: peptidase domain-containing ABC transporter [Firmicutes bacterium]|nr:peptidase domain-containing ABC transporter [Bacillota bacterium]
MKKKMVIIRQQDAKDCGPCALKSIIEYYGGYVSLERIREHAYTSYEGTSVYHLVQAAKKYGFDAIAKKYLDNQIKNIKLPAIVHVRYANGQTHFMCLYELAKEKIILMDPAKGKVYLTYEEFNNIFTGIVIEFSAKNEIVCLEKESNIYTLFFNLIKQNKKLCFNLLGCSILLTVLTIFSGLYFKVGYEYLQNGVYENTLKYLIYLFLTIFILKVLFGFFKNYYENHINKNIDVSIFSTFIVHVFKLPLKVINTRSVGEFISRINELGSIKDIFSKLFISCFLELILSVGAIIIMFYINQRLSFFLCLVMALYIIISILFNPYLYKRIKRNIDFQTEVNSNLIENLNMINSIKNLNKTSEALENIEGKLCNLIYDNFTFNNALNGFEFFRNSISEIGFFVINTYGFYLIYNGNLSFVDLVVFNTLTAYFMDPIKNIITLIPNFNFFRASFKKICDFIDLEEEQLGEEEQFKNGNICFKDVEFSYNDYSKIVDSFNLTIRQGEKIMLKGQSGCGKSTLCQLLQRIYNPSKGSITINDKNIIDYSLRTLRNNIVYVGQKENLYSDTIKNNINFYRSNNKNFDKVCEICLINKIVDKKSFRYDFGIDNNFANLSGGEKQRIVLARALLRGGDILILDEALSEVDFKSEEKIINNIKNSYPEKTLIYISHKKQDKLFDRVIGMKANCE